MKGNTVAANAKLIQSVLKACHYLYITEHFDYFHLHYLSTLRYGDAGEKNRGVRIIHA